MHKWKQNLVIKNSKNSKFWKKKIWGKSKILVIKRVNVKSKLKNKTWTKVEL